MKMPLFTHAFIDRHGKARFYLRRKGFKKVPLPGLPWSPAFMAAREAALSGEAARIEIGPIRNGAGTMNALIHGYFLSETFLSHAAGTRQQRRYILERFAKENGEKRFALLRSDHIKLILSKKQATPFAWRNLLKALRALMTFAVAEGHLQADPTAGIKLMKAKTPGIRTWTEEELAQFEAYWLIGTKERLALALLVHTAQRRSDVVKMGRQHIRAGVIKVVQQKTGAALAVPIHPDLQVILDATPSEHLTFLVTSHGKPFTASGFGNWFTRVCREADLPRGLSAHGLRKAACRRLAEAGCSANVIASISGHVSLKEVERYTKMADQERMARSGMQSLVADKQRTSRWPT